LGAITIANDNRYCYDYKVNGVIKHSGITQDTKRREQEHQQRWPGGKLEVVKGPVTEAVAREWEKTKQKAITPQR